VCLLRTVVAALGFGDACSWAAESFAENSVSASPYQQCYVHDRTPHQITLWFQKGWGLREETVL
jgi:hypothetical protein